MHVFITGGTGLIGSTVVAELLGNGHTVLAGVSGLVRSWVVNVQVRGGSRGDWVYYPCQRWGA
jgi:nucleoside-diphosphate-sugar epimerase